MRLYKQRTRSDCTLTVLENIIQRPREKIRGIYWYRGEGSKRVTYTSIANVSRFYRKMKFKNRGEIYLDKYPAFLGHLLLVEGKIDCHALLWTGDKIIETYTGKTVSFEKVCLAYTFVDFRNCSTGCALNVEAICREWDENICRAKRGQKESVRLPFYGVGISVNSEKFPFRHDNLKEGLDIYL